MGSNRNIIPPPPSQYRTSFCRYCAPSSIWFSSVPTLTVDVSELHLHSEHILFLCMWLKMPETLCGTWRNEIPNIIPMYPPMLAQRLLIPKLLTFVVSSKDWVLSPRSQNIAYIHLRIKNILLNNVLSDIYRYLVCNV